MRYYYLPSLGISHGENFKPKWVANSSSHEWQLSAAGIAADAALLHVLRIPDKRDNVLSLEI